MRLEKGSWAWKRNQDYPRVRIVESIGQLTFCCASCRRVKCQELLFLALCGVVMLAGLVRIDECW